MANLINRLRAVQAEPGVNEFAALRFLRDYDHTVNVPWWLSSLISKKLRTFNRIGRTVAVLIYSYNDSNYNTVG